MKKPPDNYTPRLFEEYTEEQAIAAFWAKVSVKGPDECWLWKGQKRGGYGRVWWRGKLITAHRLAFFLTGGVLGEKEKVCHSCDVHGCCNPKHLFAGTQRQNMEDCVWKDRHSKGERHTTAKLTDDEVRQIRQQYAAGIKQAELAERYGVHNMTISRIVRRKRWRHLL